MANYTTISDATLTTGQPILATTGRALRDNPIAIAKGASGAPKIISPALDLYYGAGGRSSGAGDGVLLTITNLTPNTYVLVFATVTANHGSMGTSSLQLYYALSSNNGTTWGSNNPLVSTSASSVLTTRTEHNNSYIALGTANAIRFYVDFTIGSGGSGSAQVSVSGFGV